MNAITVLQPKNLRKLHAAATVTTTGALAVVPTAVRPAAQFTAPGTAVVTLGAVTGAGSVVFNFEQSKDGTTWAAVPLDPAPKTYTNASADLAHPVPLVQVVGPYLRCVPTITGTLSVAVENVVLVGKPGRSTDADGAVIAQPAF